MCQFVTLKKCNHGKDERYENKETKSFMFDNLNSSDFF